MRTNSNPVASVISAIPPPAQVLIAIVSIQIGASFAVGLFASFSPLGTVFFRVCIAAILLCLFIRPKFTAETFKHAKLLIAYGVMLGLMNWCFYEAIARIPLGIVVTIEFMGPLIVAAISSKTRIDYFWIAIAMIGLLMLTPRIGADLDIIGVSFAVLAGIGWAGFVVLSKKVNVALEGNDGLALGMLIAAIFLAMFSFREIPVALGDATLMLSLLLIAVLSTTIPFFLEFNALKKLTPQTYGVLITLEPAAAAVIGMLVLGDVLGIAGLIAIVCVTSAAIGATITRVDD